MNTDFIKNKLRNLFFTWNAVKLLALIPAPNPKLQTLYCIFNEKLLAFWAQSKKWCKTKGKTNEMK